jgi:hypothetical protein
VTFGLFRRDFQIIQKGLPDYSEGTSGLFRRASGLFRRDFQIIQARLFFI